MPCINKDAVTQTLLHFLTFKNRPLHIIVQKKNVGAKKLVMPIIIYHSHPQKSVNNGKLKKKKQNSCMNFASQRMALVVVLYIFTDRTI